MRLSNLAFALLLLSFFSYSCEDAESENIIEEQLTEGDYLFTFEKGTEEWVGDFADYPFGEEDFYELDFRHTNLPAPLDTSKGALMQRGSNRSDDLFMFINRKIDGLQPNTNYKVQLDVEFASDVPDGWSGIGGAPGESVYIKAGAVGVEPVKIDSANAPGVGYTQYYFMNIDKGNQSQEGTDIKNIGDFSNDTDINEYTLKLVSSGQLSVQTNNAGELWLIVGTDSGFEGITTIYYSSIAAKVEKQEL